MKLLLAFILSSIALLAQNTSPCSGAPSNSATDRAGAHRQWFREDAAVQVDRWGWRNWNSNQRCHFLADHWRSHHDHGNSRLPYVRCHDDNWARGYLRL